MLTASVPLMYIGGLMIGLTAGYLMHRSDYCLAGMFRDAILFRNPFMLRILFLHIAVSAVLFEGARQLGLLPLYPFPILASPSLVNLAGGLLFGVGMVLAGGCVVGTLYKMGAGSIISLTAFAGLIVGSGMYAEIHPWWKSIARGATFWKGSITVPQLLGIDPLWPVTLTGLTAFLVVLRWRRQGLLTRPAMVRGYIQPWKTACLLALLGLFSYLAVGMPLGVSTTYAKLAAMAENLVVPGHVAEVAFYRLTPLDVVHPFTGAELKGQPGPGIDSIWIIQFPVIAGIVLGSGLSARLLNEFAIYTHVPGKQIITAFCGGVLLALASRMAPSCNVWHLLGGLPIFALQSLLFVTGLLPGAWLGGKLLLRILERRPPLRG